jgi:hypothetical protein
MTDDGREGQRETKSQEYIFPSCSVDGSFNKELITIHFEKKLYIAGRRLWLSLRVRHFNNRISTNPIQLQEQINSNYTCCTHSHSIIVCTKLSPSFNHFRRRKDIVCLHSMPKLKSWIQRFIYLTWDFLNTLFLLYFSMLSPSSFIITVRMYSKQFLSCALSRYYNGTLLALQSHFSAWTGNFWYHVLHPIGICYKINI